MKNEEHYKQENISEVDGKDNHLSLEDRVGNTMNNMLCSLMWIRVVLRRHHRATYRGRHLRANGLIKLA